VIIYDPKNLELTNLTPVKEFLSYVSKEVLLGEPDELDELADRLMKDYVRTVKQLQKLTDKAWEKYEVPEPLLEAIIEELDKIDGGRKVKKTQAQDSQGEGEESKSTE
jgi:hypothetical protein